MGVTWRNETAAAQKLVYYHLGRWVYMHLTELHVRLTHHKDTKDLQANLFPTWLSHRQGAALCSNSFQSLFPFWQSRASIHRVIARVQLVCKFCASGRPDVEFCEQYLWFLFLKNKATERIFAHWKKNYIHKYLHYCLLPDH